MLGFACGIHAALTNGERITDPEVQQFYSWVKEEVGNRHSEDYIAQQVAFALGEQVDKDGRQIKSGYKAWANNRKQRASGPIKFA